jgi:hypothetical protein
MQAVSLHPDGLIARRTKKAVLKENERGDCQVALLLGQLEKEMQPFPTCPVGSSG